MSFADRLLGGADPRAAGLDGDAAGVWSEWMLFDGTRWDERRCEAAAALCGILRASAAVSGRVVAPDGSVTPPQGQVTIFRLRPSAHVLPHVGVTNRRLVLQFPLRGWHGVRFRVDDEWRSYAEGRALVFDDSFEHEVVHAGAADRLVLYAVLHHPGLGEPSLGEPRWRQPSRAVRRVRPRAAHTRSSGVRGRASRRRCGRRTQRRVAYCSLRCGPYSAGVRATGDSPAQCTRYGGLGVWRSAMDGSVRRTYRTSYREHVSVRGRSCALLVGRKTRGARLNSAHVTSTQEQRVECEACISDVQR